MATAPPPVGRGGGAIAMAVGVVGASAKVSSPHPGLVEGQSHWPGPGVAGLSQLSEGQPLVGRVASPHQGASDPYGHCRRPTGCGAAATGGR